MIKAQKIITDFFIKNWRYIVVILLLCFAFFNMQNPNPNQIADIITPYADQILNLQNDSYIIASDQEYVSTKTVFNSNTGDYYRLFFQIKATNNTTIGPKTNKSKVSVILAKDDGNRQVLSDVSVDQDGKIVTKEMVFKTNDRFSYLIFQRSDPNYDPEIEIDRIYLSRLACQNDQCLSALDQTILGNSSGIEIAPEMTSHNDNLYKFGNRKADFGQIFLAENDNLSAVNLALDTVGDGGLGDYQVTVKKARRDGSSFIVDPVVLASFRFKPSAMVKYSSDKNIYHFPLALDTAKGGYYFLAINNFQAQSNHFNSIRVLGSSDTTSYLAGGAYLSGSTRDYGDLFLRVESSQVVVHDGVNIPFNAIIEDIGQGTKQYRYKFNRSSGDYLDIFDKSFATTQSPYLDSAIGGVLALVSDRRVFSYKFDTLKPFKQIEFKYKQIGADFVNTLGYYSL